MLGAVPLWGCAEGQAWALSCWDQLMGVEFPPSSHEQIFFLGKISRTWSPWPDSRLVSSARGKLFYRVSSKT